MEAGPLQMDCAGWPLSQRLFPDSLTLVSVHILEARIECLLSPLSMLLSQGI